MTKVDKYQQLSKEINEYIKYHLEVFNSEPTYEDVSILAYDTGYVAGSADLQAQVDELVKENNHIHRQIADEKSGIQDQSLEKHLRWELSKLQQQIADYEKALKEIYAGNGLIPIDGKVSREQTIAFKALDKYTEQI